MVNSVDEIVKKSTVFCFELTITPSVELMNLINSGWDCVASPVDLTSTLLMLKPSLTKAFSSSAASSSHPIMKRVAVKENNNSNSLLLYSYLSPYYF